MEKKHLNAASRNKEPIFQVLNPMLKQLLADKMVSKAAFEIATGHDSPRVLVDLEASSSSPSSVTPPVDDVRKF